MALGSLAGSPLTLLVSFAGAEVAFALLFALVLIQSTKQTQSTRLAGVMALAAITYGMERSMTQVCLANHRPHWAATVASLLWVQLMSASELLLASRVDGSQLPHSGRLASAVGLLWNVRRIGTQWQVKNVPPTESQSRADFVFRRLAVLLVAYLFVDVVVSMPPPDAAFIQVEKATLFSLGTLSIDDVIFRSAMTISYWITTGTLNLFMANMGAVIAVLLRLSAPADCPPLYGSFFEAYTVRRFWGISWHQMFRSFLTGHADLIMDNILPFVPRSSLVSRYGRLTIAFLISGLIHARAEQLMGVPDAENGAVVVFLLHALIIMIEDAALPVASKVLPITLRRVLGWLWVLAFFIWTCPIWIYSGARLGLNSAALLPVRLVGPKVAQALAN